MIPKRALLDLVRALCCIGCLCACSSGGSKPDEAAGGNGAQTGGSDAGGSGGDAASGGSSSAGSGGHSGAGGNTAGSGGGSSGSGGRSGAGGSSAGSGGSTAGSGGSSAGSGGSTAGTGGATAGSGGAGVPPSSGPASCGCAEGQVCVRWALPPQPARVDCWDVEDECLALLSPASTQAVCSCFNPCNPPGTSGNFCQDANSTPAVDAAPEDIWCVQGNP
jgi:hypothetical protein